MTGAHQPIVVSEGMADHLKSSFAILGLLPEPLGVKAHFLDVVIS